MGVIAISESRSKILIENKTYDQELLLTDYNGPRNTTGTNIITQRVEFINCHFSIGLKINFNSNTHLGHLQIIFQNCIFGKITINTPKNPSLNGKYSNHSIEFYSCISNKLEVLNSQFKSLILSGFILSNNALTTQDSNISLVTMIDCIGQYFVNLNENDSTQISFSLNKNSEIKFSNKPIYEAYQIIINKITSELKTVFHVHNAKDILFISALDLEFKNPKPDLGEHIKNAILPNIHFSAAPNYPSNIRIQKSRLSSATIIGDSFNEVIIEDTICKSIYLHKFKSQRTKLYNINPLNPESKFEILNSDLTNAWFNKINLKEFEIVNFYRSTLEKCEFSATPLPNNIESLENIHYIDKKEKDYHEMQYDNYKQLKTALIKQGDKIQVLRMHSAMFEAIRKSKNLDRSDKFILSLNSWSNNHGTSIGQALMLFLTLSVLLTFFYCISLPSAPYSFGFNNLSDWIKGIGLCIAYTYENMNTFFILANPTHKISTLIALSETKDISTANYFWSFISRILIAWSVYQFISAFRKFGKKM